MTACQECWYSHFDGDAGVSIVYSRSVGVEPLLSMKPCVLFLLLLVCWAFLATTPGVAGERVAAAEPARSGKTSQGNPFAYWTPKNRSTRAALVLIHGFGLHKGAFDSFASRMQVEGIASYAVDLRGFGAWRTEKQDSRQLQFDQSLIDIGSTLMWVRKMNPGKPVVVLGESMGGAFAIEAAAMYPDLVDGVIAAVPSKEFFGKGKTTCRALLMSLRPDDQFDVSQDLINKATRDESLKRQWKTDPQARFEVSPKELLKFELFVKQVGKRAAEINNKPVLLLHGSQDRLAKQNGTLEIFNQLKTSDRELTMLNAEHLLLEMGQCNDKTCSVLLDWLNRHFL